MICDYCGAPDWERCPCRRYLANGTARTLRNAAPRLIAQARMVNDMARGRKEGS